MKGNNKKLIDNMVDMSLHLLPTKELHGASITVQLFPSLTGLDSNKQENTIFVGGKATDSVTRWLDYWFNIRTFTTTKICPIT